jgi:hypothetical protein
VDPNKSGDHILVAEMNRMRPSLVQYEVIIFTKMTVAMKEIAVAIRDINPVNVYPRLYTVFMDASSFNS